MNHIVFDGHYHALHFGVQKINLHPAGSEYQLHAARPLPGTGDLCLVALGSIDEVVEKLRAEGVALEHGPVPQTGTVGQMMSVYFRDPDENLIEVNCYPP